MKNPLKEKLKKGEAVIGTFVSIGHPDITERISRLGFDWLVLDSEHGTLSYETMKGMMQSMGGSSCIPIVRPQWNDFVVIKRVLDIGAYGVLVPWVNSKEEAEMAVRACKYPPEGIRGFAGRRAQKFDPDYFKTANDEILIAVQVETPKAIENLGEILSVPGVDVCYVGPSDLSCNLGFGMPPKWNEPRYLEAFDQVLAIAKQCGKPAGMFATFDNIDWALEKGFIFNTVGSAESFMVQGAQMALAKARGAVK